MHKIIILWLALLSPWVFSSLAAQALTDTLWSVPSLDGGIAYRPISGIFNLSTTSSTLGAGDGYDAILFQEVFGRSFLSFDLSNIQTKDSVEIIQATIGLYQLWSFGNDSVGVYPIWNVAGGDTHFCVLDHIDYGNSLDLGDWTAGDPGDSQTLHTNIGVISDNPILEYKTLDVTPYIREDLQEGRNYTQYRIRFTVDLDYDSLADRLLCISGNSANPSKPFLTIQYDTTSVNIESSFAIIEDLKLRQNYPNPFNSSTVITYDLNKTGTLELYVFNAAGQTVFCIKKEKEIPGRHEIKLDASGWPSGVYFYQLRFNNNQSVAKKMILIR